MTSTHHPCPRPVDARPDAHPEALPEARPDPGAAPGLAALTHRAWQGAVHVVSPYEVVRRGLAAMLNAAMPPSNAPPSRAGRRRVVIWDVELSLGDDLGLHAAHLHHLTRRPDTAVLALGHPERSAPWGRDAPAGARALISYDVSADDLVGTVLQATHHDHRAGRHHERVVPRPAPRFGGRWDLTAREAQVLALVGQGFSNQEIADICCLSINSVKTHIRGAYRKIGVTSRSLAVGWCVRHGLTEAWSPHVGQARPSS